MTGMTTEARERAAGHIRQVAGRGLDVAAFWRECNEVLATAVPHYLAPCWFTFDPASLLVTSHYDPVIPEIDGALLTHEYGQDDVLKMADVARGQSGVATIHEATGGDPSRSPGWRSYVQPYGGDQQLLVALRSKPGEAWGCWRCTGRRDSRSSARRRSDSWPTWRRRWPTGPGAGCWWARQPTPRARTRPA